MGVVIEICVKYPGVPLEWPWLVYQHYYTVASRYTVERSRLRPQVQVFYTHSGFHLDPELASRDEGAPREERTLGAVGGVVPIATTNHHKPFLEFKNVDFKRSYGRFGPTKYGLKPGSLDTGI
jgi:hypothetical protein